jgi:hypothetical protein
MAVHNRLPEMPEDMPPRPARGRRRSLWPPILIAIAIAVLIGIIIWISRTPHRAGHAGAITATQKVDAFTFSDLRVASNTPPVVVEGKLHNGGTQPLSVLTVAATFKGLSGNELETIRTQVQPANGGRLNVQPGQTESIKMKFEHVPSGWDQKPPELKIVNAGQASGGK